MATLDQKRMNKFQVVTIHNYDRSLNRYSKLFQKYVSSLLNNLLRLLFLRFFEIIFREFIFTSILWPFLQISPTLREAHLIYTLNI